MRHGTGLLPSSSPGVNRGGGGLFPQPDGIAAARLRASGFHAAFAACPPEHSAQRSVETLHPCLAARLAKRSRASPEPACLYPRQGAEPLFGWRPRHTGEPLGSPVRRETLRVSPVGLCALIERLDGSALRQFQPDISRTNDRLSTIREVGLSVSPTSRSELHPVRAACG